MPSLSELAALNAEGGIAARGDTVLVTDASAEGETIAAALRERGLHVVDVPLALLEGRVAFEAPRVVLVDVDEPGALERVAQLLERPGGAGFAVLGIGDPMQGVEERRGLDRTFERPVNLHQLVELVLTFASPRGSSSRGTTPPPSYAPRPTSPPMPGSERPSASDPPAAPDDDVMDEFGLAEDALGPLPMGSPIPLSPELEAILFAAEQKVAQQYARNSNVPASDEAPDDDGKMLPQELLAALDEPLGPADAGEGTGAADGTGTPTGWPRSGTGTSDRSMQTRDGRESARSEGAEGSRSGAELELGDGTGGTGLGTGSGTGAGTGAGLDGEEPSYVGGVVDSLRPQGTLPPASSGFASPTATAGPPSVSSLTAAAMATSSAYPSGREEPSSREGGSPDGARAAAPSYPANTNLAPGLPAALRALPSLEQQHSAAVSWERVEEGAGGSGPATASSPWGSWSAPATAPAAAPPSSIPGSPISPISPSSQGSQGQGFGGPPVTARDQPALPEVYVADDAKKLVARAIGTRASGVLALRTDAGTRHIVLHEGDLVTAASTSADETLAAFLVERGDVGRDTLGRLGARLPASGRLAGAALIANGYLAQDDLWSVLRSHAEWIVARAIVSGPGSCQLEPEPGGRLKSEPGVFGGAAGAEVFVEIVRRTIPPAAAIARLGGPSTRIDVGPRASLITECALTREEEAITRALPGRSVGEVLAREGEDFASVLLALSDLEVLTVLAAPRRAESAARTDDDPLDDEAVRVRVRARLALVAEGDYFSILGVARDATPYELKRAYLELRRTFEPSRLLTARTADLADDLLVVLEVADEAYEILRDANRRERYRRAIENGPPGTG